MGMPERVVILPASAPVPSTRPLDQTNDPCTDNPCEKRLVALNCSESYHVLPIGGPRSTAPGEVNWGDGRRLWATVCVSGIPGYAGPKPAATACGELSKLVSKLRFAGLLRLSPCAARSAGVRLLEEI